MSELRQQIAENAAAAVKHLSERPGTILDYSEASLAVIEEVLAEIAFNKQHLDPKDLDGLVGAIGAYILETATRAHGGVFYWHKQNNEPVLVVGEPDFHVAIVVSAKVRGRISGDESNNIPFFYDAFATQVRSASPGTNVIIV